MYIPNYQCTYRNIIDEDFNVKRFLRRALQRVERYRVKNEKVLWIAERYRVKNEKGASNGGAIWRPIKKASSLRGFFIDSDLNNPVPDIIPRYP